MPRVPFSTVFRKNPDNSIEPTQQVRIGGLVIGQGTKLTPGQIIAGVDLTQYEDRDFEIGVDGDVLVIKAVYGPRK